MKKCPKCNLEIYSELAKFCKKCGTNIENEPIIMIENSDEGAKSDLKDEFITIAKNGKPQNQPKPVAINTYTPEINGFFKFVLWMIVLGGILTPIIGLATFNVADYGGSIWLILSDLSVYILTPIYAIYVVVSTYKRRSGAVFLLKAYLMTILMYKLLVQLVIGYASINVSTFSGFIWNIAFLLYVCFSEKVSDNFPKEIRKVSAFDMIMIWSYILIPLFTLILGCLH